MSKKPAVRSEFLEGRTMCIINEINKAVDARRVFQFTDTSVQRVPSKLRDGDALRVPDVGLAGIFVGAANDIFRVHELGLPGVVWGGSKDFRRLALTLARTDLYTAIFIDVAGLEVLGGLGDAERMARAYVKVRKMGRMTFDAAMTRWDVIRAAWPGRGEP